MKTNAQMHAHPTRSSESAAESCRNQEESLSKVEQAKILLGQILTCKHTTEE
jgi:hypothetical protein